MPSKKNDEFSKESRKFQKIVILYFVKIRNEKLIYSA